MTGKPYRLIEGGGRIDRNAHVTFSFDGRDVQGFAGDTVASAVLPALPGVLVCWKCRSSRSIERLAHAAA